jgi:hypothetical protein
MAVAAGVWKKPVRSHPQPVQQPYREVYIIILALGNFRTGGCGCCGLLPEARIDFVIFPPPLLF